ncbi:MAG: glycosyltransferase family 87 protein [Anaerolineae bacterium]
MKFTRILSLDSLLLLLSVFPMLYLRESYVDSQRFVLPPAAIGAFADIAYWLLFAYLLVDFVGRRRDTTRIRLGLLGLLIVTIAIAPTLTSMVLRYRAGDPAQYAHDNPVQVEAAADYLLHGVNPYGADYFATPLARWSGYTGATYSNNPNDVPPPDWKVNPALYHVVSLPFGLLAAVPFDVVSRAIFGWFDARVLYLAAYGLSLFLIDRVVTDPTRRLAALIAVGLNPLLVSFLVEGRNDILVFSLVLASAVAWQKRRLDLSGVLLGLAIMTKHIAILFLPFYALLGWQATLPLRKRVLQLGRHLLPVFWIALLLAVPFLIWNWRSFYDDTFGYLAGSAGHAYPLSGMGFGGLVVTWGWVPNAGVPFPSLLYQLAFGVPILVLLLWVQWRQNTIRLALAAYAIFLLVYMWFARFFFDNYLGYIIMLLAVAYFWPSDEPSPAEAEAA